MANHVESRQPAPAPQAAVIRRLTIQRFRGITALSWHPGPRVNVILGGGDVGKTTILEAIGLLLSPTNAGTLSDTDYHARGTENLELAYEILQPDGTPDRLSVALRRSIGLVRLGGDDRSDRDLRLVQGSALDRLLSDQALRSRIANALVDTDVEETLR